jgi:hypothetical protein
VPRLIETDTDEAIDLDTLVDLLDQGGFDARDEDNFASFGLALKKLANNRTFLTDLVLAELKDRCERQIRDNQYGSQVVLLPTSSSKYLMRANFWPSAKDSIVKQSGTNPFIYGVPHDHNFSFLTVGYLGPGYWSEYYEYDYQSVAGFTGEKVDLRFVEKSKLDEGKVMLYRAHRDVHNQLLADAMSISLNILETDYAINFRDQYRFDLESGTITGFLNQTPLDPLLMLSAHFGGGNGRDLLKDFAARHPSDRIRWKALEAQAGTLATIDDRIAWFEGAVRGSSRFIAGMARRKIETLERSRAWIEGVPQLQAAE